LRLPNIFQQCKKNGKCPPKFRQVEFIQRAIFCHHIDVVDVSAEQCKTNEYPIDIRQEQKIDIGNGSTALGHPIVLIVVDRHGHNPSKDLVQERLWRLTGSVNLEYSIYVDKKGSQILHQSDFTNTFDRRYDLGPLTIRYIHTFFHMRCQLRLLVNTDRAVVVLGKESRNINGIGLIEQTSDTICRKVPEKYVTRCCLGDVLQRQFLAPNVIRAMLLSRQKIGTVLGLNDRNPSRFEDSSKAWLE